MSGALLELRGATRRYVLGGQEVYALREIDLDIAAGEMVALMGASGSGKSTLMNVLGCLDRLDEGSYRVAGEDVSALDPDALAALRRARFGFVFQRYNLLPQLSALANVEIPAIYAGLERTARRARVQILLERLGLGDRADHRPNQLSGGQQQRVSIARALMNGGSIILADEPTGALDSHTGKEAMALLLELNRLGHTIVIATHDPAVAAFARRIIQLADGRIVVDRVQEERNEEATGSKTVAAEGPSRDVLIATPDTPPVPERPLLAAAAFMGRYGEAAHMAIVALLSHRMRTALTLLGVVIGIVSVVTMVALGEAAKRYLARELEGFTRNTLEIYPGREWGDPEAFRIQTLTNLDVQALTQQPFVTEASPLQSQATLLRRRQLSASGVVNGVNVSYFKITGLSIIEGLNFSVSDQRRQSQVVVIDSNVKGRFFGHENPIGETLYIGNLACVVIGVTAHQWQNETSEGAKLNVWLPFTTFAARFSGRSYLDGIKLSLPSGLSPRLAEEAIAYRLMQRHKRKDFLIFNLSERIQSTASLFDAMSLLLAAIGVISLTVGGIGVMNIMLVSVAERSREIGVRIAVGARQSDIRRQFLIESVLVCLTGAAIGVVLSFIACKIANYFLPPKWEVWVSLPALLMAVASAMLTGVIFGYVPARNAARLDPVEALARE